jgi:hypothetical protein
MSIEERPRRYDKEEGQSSSTQTDIECEFDVLEEEAYDERDGLDCVRSINEKPRSWFLTPTVARRAVASNSASF